MIAVVTGFNRFDFLYHVHTLSYFTECTVAPTIDRLARVVKEVVVIYINKKLLKLS